jgi:hypothetical protein
VRDMNSLGYRVTDVGARNLERSEFQGLPLDPVYVFVEEKGVNRPVAPRL